MAKDYCISDSWYIANDVLFTIIGLSLIEKYYKNKKRFFVSSLLWGLLCFLVQILLICNYDFSVSYLTFGDEYWTVYFKKPFAHFHAFNIGLILGCTYFTFKYEDFNEDSHLKGLLTSLKESNTNSILSMILGCLLQLIIMILNQSNNNNPESSLAWTLIYLLLSRPLFIIGFSMLVFPIILQNKATTQLSKAMGHKYWIPYARLTYGVFLCNSVLMQFRVFNLQHGEWVQSYNANLLFGAFIVSSFIFSFFTYLFVEGPTASLLREFFVKRPRVANSASLKSQSARAHQRVTRRKSKKKINKKHPLISKEDESVETFEDESTQSK